MTTAPTFERDFYRELLEENPALLARIVAFNRGGAASASPCVRFAEELSKDEPTDVDWADLIARHPDLCALAAERTAPEEKAGDDYWGFAETSERFALIPEDELDRLVRLAAAAVYGAEIAVTVRKDEREALRAKLGDDLLRYAVLRGRWQAGSLAGELKRFCAGLPTRSSGFRTWSPFFSGRTGPKVFATRRLCVLRRTGRRSGTRPRTRSSAAACAPFC